MSASVGLGSGLVSVGLVSVGLASVGFSGDGVGVGVGALASGLVSVDVGGGCGVEFVGAGALGTEVSGTPEPGLGVAGLDCAPAEMPDRTTNRTASKAIGERCIVF